MTIFSRQLLLLSFIFVSSKAICPKSAVPGTIPGSCYFGVNFNQSFQRGDAFCSDFYAKLASIPSSEDNTAILNLARQFGENTKQVWIGGTFDGKNITWLDGSSTTFNNVQPDTAPGDMVMDLDTGKWKTAAWNGLLPFICGQKEGVSPSTPPNITTTAPPSPITSPLCTCPTAPPPIIPSPCPPPPTCPKQSPCPSEWTYSATLKKCYKTVFDIHYDRNGDPCTSMGATLASIHSDEESRVVRDVLRMGIGPIPYTWAGMIGGKRTGGGASDWVWMDGTPWDYSLWAAGQPDNSKGNEYCLQVYNDMPEKVDPGNWGKWNDIPCSTWFRAAICKRTADY